MNNPNNSECHFCGIRLDSINASWREVTIIDDDSGESKFVCNDCAEVRYCDMCDKITNHPLPMCPGLTVNAVNHQKKLWEIEETL